MARPKDLRFPFTWEERHILIDNKVWFVPPRPLPLPFDFPGWNDQELFGNSNPIHIEYCSGNGDWIIEKAKNNPNSNWMAVEKKFDRVKKIRSKLVNNGLTNLVIVWAEAFEFTRQHLPLESVQEVFVNFPDPWPKRKHAENRIIRPEFVLQLARIIKPDGTLTLVTDDEAYAAKMIIDVPSTGHFVNQLPSPFFREVPVDYGSSFFESLFRSQSKIIRQFLFSKKAAFS